MPVKLTRLDRECCMPVREAKSNLESLSIQLLPIVGLGLVGLLSLGPLILEPLPATWIEPSATPFGPLAGRTLVLLVCCSVIGLPGWIDATEKTPSRFLPTLMIVIAAGMTA